MKTEPRLEPPDQLPDRKLIAETILGMVQTRGAGKSICPSEVARHLFPQGWRGWMEVVRQEAGKLQRERKICITQKGQEVRLEDTRGAIRLSSPPPTH
ncbi:DUF3253 domain-containing protein [Prosthecobacter debontii]|uniref:DUF3253 domain-containing protein n=1 Tax=Prosthecobacter debontii TaxID=48467 RepID=UPI001C37DF0D